MYRSTWTLGLRLNAKLSVREKASENTHLSTGFLVMEMFSKPDYFWNYFQNKVLNIAINEWTEKISGMASKKTIRFKRFKREKQSCKD